MITVNRIIDQVLPEGATTVAGGTGLSGEVSWATRPRPTPPAFGHLRGGELVLLTERSLARLDQRMTLERAVAQLAGFGVGAIAYAGSTTSAARTVAENAGIPLIEVPSGSDLALAEREASHLIAEYRREAQRVGHEASRRLMELAIGGESLEDLAVTLAEMAQLDVIVEGRDGALLEMTSPKGHVPTKARIAPLLERGRRELSSWIGQTGAASPAEPPTRSVSWDATSYRVVAPIIGRNELLGVISLLPTTEHPTDDQLFLASRGAAACAVVLAREQAAAVARQELELNVLDEMLDGALRSEVSLLEQARLLGFDIERPHVAVVLRIEKQGRTPDRGNRVDVVSLVEELLVDKPDSVLWRYRSSQAEIVWPVSGEEEARSVTYAFQADLAQRVGSANTQVSAGVGTAQAGMKGVRRSYQEARHALFISRRLRRDHGLTFFHELGVHRLLFAARDLGEMRTFHDEALSRLIEYDREHGSDLIETLRAYFDGRCGPKEAASILGVHRNTVLYRIERIEELTGLDLDNPEVRLRLHLALYAHDALFAEQSAISTS